ncbi:hypothetical protein Sjap_002259 [Stephania japonica]|uniref:Uncharacterized protein n=1 Tax=Stephania japonica TaxID=461633 RepID=A0AAP0PUD6_9MAGN
MLVSKSQELGFLQLVDCGHDVWDGIFNRLALASSYMVFNLDCEAGYLILVIYCLGFRRMAEQVMANDLMEMLKPFYIRASEAEVSLAGSKKDDEKAELLKTVSELQSKLEEAKSEQMLERQKASMEIQNLVSQNGKLQYQVAHLVRALKDAMGS